MNGRMMITTVAEERPRHGRQTFGPSDLPTANNKRFLLFRRAGALSVT